MSSERKNSRLPPPAFPPGTRKHVHRNSTSPKKGAAADADPFISPDEPIPPRSDAVAGAFISPDDPIPARAQGGEPEAEGVVTGIGFDAHLDPEELVTGGDPYVLEVVDAVRKLADALKRKGEAGLRALPGMSRFEATLRSYCVGYLAGRRAEDEAERLDVSLRTQPKAEPPTF